MCPAATADLSLRPVHTICAQVDEEYLEALLLLGRKIAFISTNNAAAGSAAAKDVAAVLEKLRIRAIIKVGHCGLMPCLPWV